MIPTYPAKGTTLYRAEGNPSRIRVPCPVCAGKLALVVILGDGEEVGIECDNCGKGYSGPQGHVSACGWQRRNCRPESRDTQSSRTSRRRAMRKRSSGEGRSSLLAAFSA